MLRDRTRRHSDARPVPHGCRHSGRAAHEASASRDCPHPFRRSCIISAATAARSFLFVPASRPDRFAKALDSASDCIILDLEDAVAPQDKAVARKAIAQGLVTFTVAQPDRTLVRINAPGTAWHEDDLALLSPWVRKGLGGVMVAKSETPATLDSARAVLGEGSRLVPLIESLEGLDAVQLLARVPGVARLAFGHLDFQLDLGMRCGGEESELASVRLQFVACSRRADLPPPIDGVTTDVRDVERVKSDAFRARAFGFGAKLCIHPDQVAEVNDAFSASTAELDWSRRVLEGAKANEGKAFSLDGHMVDLPVVRLAQRTLLQSNRSS